MATWQGGVLDDTKDGGDENDTFYGSWGDDTLSGGGANDTLDGQEGNDHLYGDSGDDVLWGDRGILFGGNDHLYGGSGSDILHGGNENDYLYGGTNRDFLYGGADNDHLYGESGNDDLYGGSGDDYVSGGDGDDYIYDSNGVDELRGGDGNDIIVVNGGDLLRFDLVYGGADNDTIYANDTNLIVDGGSGNDTIFTEARRDTFLEGGTGSDRFVVDFAPGDGVDEWIDVQDGPVQIYGGDAYIERHIVGGAHVIGDHYQTSDASVDTLDLSQWGTEDGASVILSWNLFGEGEYFVDDAPYDEGQATSNNVDYLQVGNIYGIENVVGTAQRDQIWGDGAGNDLIGMDGDDYMSGGGGIDSLIGGEGNDTLFGGTGTDVLEGGTENDTLDGGDESDTLSGGAGRDTLIGGAGNDYLYGDLYEDGVYADELTGGAGADTFTFANVGKLSMLGLVKGQLTMVSTPIVDTITDFDTTGADHDLLALGELFNARTNFTGTGLQQARDQGYIYFTALPNQAGTRVMIDLNGGAHTDTANIFALVDLENVAVADVQNRPELFLI